MTFKIPCITCQPSDIILACTWAVGHYFHLYVGLHGPGWLYCTLTPRTRVTDLGQGPNLRAWSGRAPYVPRSREHEERRAAGRDKNAEGPIKHIYIYTSYIICISIIPRNRYQVCCKKQAGRFLQAEIALGRVEEGSVGPSNEAEG